MPKSRSSAINNYSSQTSKTLYFLESSAPDWLTM